MARIARAGGALLGAAVGFQVAQTLLPLADGGLNGWHRFGVQLLGGVVGAGVGAGIGPSLWRRFVRVMAGVLAWLHRMPLRELTVGLVGLSAGLVLAAAIGYLLSGIPVIGGYLRLAALLVFGYLGWHFAQLWREDLSALWERSTRRRGTAKVLDTSAIIDGRIADVVRTGFLEGPLLVPRSVLRELQAIADSSDPLRRSRGRRGLEILGRLQTELQAVQVVEDEGPGEVDERLVRLAKAHRAGIVTTDFNLSRIAELQGVRVLNVNELSSALRPVVLPGEELTVHLVREGKEPGQGVGYLEDGTMIVVEGGKRWIGTSSEVVVTSVLQTSAGRMIFARPKQEEDLRRSTG
ncbi:MAG: TRAM domain-containing protein [Armatimonadota bacterium]|nr:TRAM domain-containing protein [Armatimonadota bacterium]MDR7443673.1 TRAM domain-containing protein [Armatimonadota bacterium]MDR7570389.1 TRAM domain-containing protein [Armatimonadota bacterium]MDR7613798.1 TRAM domain-containing protein [Armatimonadota bacterium]